MKQFILATLLVIPVVMSAQITQGTQLIIDMGWLSVVSTKTGSALDTATIFNRTFTSVTADTTNAVDVQDANEVWLIMSAKDSISVLPKYQLSNDGRNWSSYAVSMDSLKVTNQSYLSKAVNVSTPADSAAYIRFILNIDTKAYAKGTTTPTYDARVKKIR